MKYAPILLFVYNRPYHTKQTVEALRKNLLAKESDLIIYSDAAKNETMLEKVNEVRKYALSIKGFKSVKVIKRKDNFGLANSIIEGVTNTVNKYGKVIVLEDDLVTSKYFLQFMNNALEKYKYEEKVISVSGYVYPIENLPENFFIKGADCWGWATWKRGWDLFEKDGQKLLKEIIGQGLQKEFDFNNTYPYVQMLKDQIEKKNSSWAIRWYASAFLKSKLTLYPKNSLINNIGNDSSGTHTKSVVHKFDTLSKVDLVKMNVYEIEIIESISARKLFEQFFKKKQSKVSMLLRSFLG